MRTWIKRDGKVIGWTYPHGRRVKASCFKLGVKKIFDTYREAAEWIRSNS